MRVQRGNLIKLLVILICTVALILVNFFFMFTEEQVAVKEAKEVPNEYQKYEPGLPVGTYVEETFVSAGDPVYGDIEKQYTMKSGQNRYTSTNYYFYTFIPCMTDSGSQVWIGDSSIIRVDGGTRLGMDQKQTLHENQMILQSLIPEDGSQFTIYGQIVATEDNAQLEPDLNTYVFLTPMLEPEKYNALSSALAEATPSGCYFKAITDSSSTHIVEEVVGYRTERHVNRFFIYLSIAELVAAVALYKRMRRPEVVEADNEIKQSNEAKSGNDIEIKPRDEEKPSNDIKKKDIKSLTEETKNQENSDSMQKKKQCCYEVKRIIDKEKDTEVGSQYEKKQENILYDDNVINIMKGDILSLLDNELIDSAGGIDAIRDPKNFAESMMCIGVNGVAYDKGFSEYKSIISGFSKAKTIQLYEAIIVNKLYKKSIFEQYENAYKNNVWIMRHNYDKYYDNKEIDGHIGNLICKKCGKEMPIDQFYQYDLCLECEKKKDLIVEGWRCYSCNSFNHIENRICQCGIKKEENDIFLDVDDFRYSARKNRGGSYETFHSVKNIPPENPEFQYAEVGIDYALGVPRIRQIRIMSYGAFMGGEDYWYSISWEKFRKITNLDITEENWKEHIPKALFEKLKAPPKLKPLSVSRQKCKKEYSDIIDYCYIKVSQRFGAHIYYIRRCGDYYRAFYLTNAEAGATILPISDIPSESKIDDIFAHYIGNKWEFYDRKLTDEEVNYFTNCFYEKKDNDSEQWNDIYGSSSTYMQICENGRKRFISGNTKFSERISNLIRILSKDGIVINK